MTNQFEKICEEFGVSSSLTTTKRMRFPKRIQFSEAFIDALRIEYQRQVLEENPEKPLKNRPALFLKGLQFVINEIKGAPIVTRTEEEDDALCHRKIRRSKSV